LLPTPGRKVSETYPPPPRNPNPNFINVRDYAHNSNTESPKYNDNAGSQRIVSSKAVSFRAGDPRFVESRFGESRFGKFFFGSNF
jgi:hypothetical protein